jgi:hypothetical protein
MRYAADYSPICDDWSYDFQNGDGPIHCMS